MAQINGTISGTGAEAAIGLGGDFTVAITGITSATITLERSFDGEVSCM